jgi:hypothetical protein
MLKEIITYIQEALYHALLSAPGAGQVGKTAVPLHQPGQAGIKERKPRQRSSFLTLEKEF